MKNSNPVPTPNKSKYVADRLLKNILLPFTLFVFTGSSQNLTSSLTACYNLNANTFDAVNNLHGNFIYGVSNVVADRFNAANSAIYMIGNSTSFISLPNNVLLKPTNEISFSCWIKFSYYNPINRILFTQNNQTNLNNMEAYELSVKTTTAGTGFVASKTGPSGTNFAITSSLILNNIWYHVAFTMDNSFIKIYLNGVLEGTTPTTFTGFDYANNGDVILGASNTYTNNFPMTGALDNMRFYNRAITAAEVGLLYAQDPSCYAGPPPAPSCNNTFYTISEGAIYAYNYGSTVTPTLIPVVLPAGAYGLAIGPPFGFTAPNPTYWVTAGGTLWYFDGLNFINSNHTTGTGVTNLGASAHFIYGQNNTNGDIFKYNGTGNAAWLCNFSAFNSAYDLVGDDMDNFYTMDFYGASGLRVHSSQGVETCSVGIPSLPGGAVSAGFAMNSASVVVHRYLNFYAGNSPPSSPFTAISYTQPGMNDFGSCPFTTNFSVTLTAQPSASISCTTPTVTINSANNSGFYLSPLNYTWSGAGGYQYYSYNFQASIPGTYFCAVHNECTGKYGSASFVVASNAAPLVPGVSASKTINCVPGNGVVLHASGATNYTWLPGPSTAANFSVNPSVTTIYTLQGAGTGTCAGSSTIEITAAANPIVTITASSQTICMGSAANLSASGASSYTWLPGYILSPNLTVSPFVTKTYTLIGNSTNSCSGKTQITIQVDSIPSISVSGSLTICSGETATLSASGTTSYTWQPGNLSGSAIGVSPLSSTLYTVTGIRAPVLCEATETVLVKVQACTGTAELLESHATKLYPNPCKDFIIIEYPEEMRVSIYETNGSVYFEGVVPKGSFKIDVRNLPPGLSTIKLVGTRHVETIKLIRID